MSSIYIEGTRTKFFFFNFTNIVEASGLRLNLSVYQICCGMLSGEQGESVYQIC